MAEIEQREWFKEPCLLGVDEAGRGPVLGPMVYGVAFAPISERESLKKKEFADSKTLTAERRDHLFEQLKKDTNIGYLVDEITASSISGSMLGRQRVSLNAMAMESTCKLIRSVLAAGVNLCEIYVDTVGDAATYQKKLSQEFPGIQFTVCPKADALYPIVSAASIAAKVSRDRAIEELTKGDDAGSGYPSDPLTKKWLEANVDAVFGFPAHVRFSWSTCDILLDKGGVKVEWECEDEGAGQGNLAAMMAGGGKRTRPRHSYFRARKLQKVATAVW